MGTNALGWGVSPSASCSTGLQRLRRSPSLGFAYAFSRPPHTSCRRRSYLPLLGLPLCPSSPSPPCSLAAGCAPSSGREGPHLRKAEEPVKSWRPARKRKLLLLTERGRGKWLRHRTPAHGRGGGERFPFGSGAPAGQPRPVSGMSGGALRTGPTATNRHWGRGESGALLSALKSRQGLVRPLLPCLPCAYS